MNARHAMPENISHTTSSNGDVVYGIHPVEELLGARPDSIHRVYITNERNQQLYDIMKQCRKDRIPYQVVPPQKLNELAGTSKHQGIVVLCSLKKFADTERLMHDIDASPDTPLLLVPASIEDPRNLGAIIRSSVAFGVSAILLERKHSVHLNATVAKASAGMLEHLPIGRPRSLEATLQQFLQKGYGLIGAVAGAQKMPHEIDFHRPTVLILGGEHRGIPPYLHALCTDFVSIPTSPIVPSLNVSVAASILLFECYRQRVKIKTPQG